MVNNFDLILSILPEEKDLNMFFHLQVLMRKKDHPTLKSKNNSSRTIRAYMIHCKEDLLNYKEEIITLSEATKSRVMINLSPKSTKSLAWAMSERLSWILQNNYMQLVSGVYNYGLGHVKPSNADRLFLIDFDTKDQKEIDEEMSKVNRKVELIVPTKNGFHYLVKPFDVRKINADVHKNNPTLLYYPNSL